MKIRTCTFLFIATLVSLMATRASGRDFPLDCMLLGLKPGTDAQSYFGDDSFLAARANRYSDNSTQRYTLRKVFTSSQALLADCDLRMTDSRVVYAEPAYTSSDIIIEPPNPGGGFIPITGTNHPPLILNPAPRVGTAGLYVGTVTVRRMLTNEKLSDSYTLKAQARVPVLGAITILTTVPESPATATTDNSVTRVSEMPSGSNEGLNNACVDGQVPAALSFQGRAMNLTYTLYLTGTTVVPAEEALSTTTFSFTFRKRSE